MQTFKSMQERAQKIAEKLIKILPKRPKIAIVLGSGWGGIAQLLQNSMQIPYAAFDEMPTCSVAGHKGNFIYGEFENKAILLLEGRFHLYEGLDAHTVVLPIQIIKNLQIEKLLLTNASGAVNANFSVGDIMLCNGHINFTGQNPLIAVPPTEQNPIFIDMTSLYQNQWHSTVQKAVEAVTPLQKGVYLQTLGPNYETANEIYAFQQWGVDAVGMSTVLELIYAHYLKLDVAALAFISNYATGVAEQKQQKNAITKDKTAIVEKLTHEDVLQNSKNSQQKLQKVIVSIIKSL